MTIDHSPSRDALATFRQFLGSRMGLILLAIAALGLGGYFNWGWLVAVGIAPIILGLLPCAAMCALGLCMSGMKSRNSTLKDNLAASANPDAKSEDKHNKGCC